MSKKINLINLIICVALITYLKPANVLLWESINGIYKIGKVITTFLIIILVLKKCPKFSVQMLSCLIFVFVWGYSIFRNNGELGDRLQELLSIIGMMFLFSYIQDKPRKIEFVFCILSKIAKLYFMLELVTIITDKPLFAEALVNGDRYFLGSDNYSAFIMLPLCGCMFAYSYMKNKRIDINTWFFSIIGFLSLAIPFSVTGMVMYLLFLLATFLISYPKIRKWMKIRNAIFVVVAFTLAVVVFNVQDYLMGVLSFIKKNGLSAREIIWPRTVAAISMKPLYGWGVLTAEQQNSYLLYGAGHAHNIVLEFLLKTGILGTSIAGLWFVSSVKGIANVKTYYMYVMQLCLFFYLFCAIFDFYLGLIYFWLMIMSINVLKNYYMDGSMHNG